MKTEITGEWIETTIKNFIRNHFEGYGCGLCQTGVPCESKIPTVNDIG